jgi:hypothetical protein
MAAKRKTRKKQTRSKTKSRKMTPAKKSVRRKASPKKKSAKKKPVKKRAVKTKAVARKTAAKKSARRKTVNTAKKRPWNNDQIVDTSRFSLDRARAGSGGQSGDLQGLSNVERADSESVDELLEEGNAFEAEVVAGVESAGAAAEKEVRTHEVPEDDVPEEYLDKEQGD